MTTKPVLIAERPVRRWSPASIAVLLAAWLVLQMSGLFSPGLLDDVDSIYIQVAREMLQRHDFVTPTIDGIRFFDKPPLMYWMAAAFMRVFGVHDWAARLPLALGVLALLAAAYALGIRLFASVSPATQPDRAGLYAALALVTSIGPYLYTRFYIPDILLALWMTLSVHLFLIALDRVCSAKSALWPMLGFSAVLAASVLTKGLIGVLFPIGFALLYLALTRQTMLLGKLHLAAATGFFLSLAAPWHILAAIRNPAINMPAGLGLPVRAGWTWFYLYNEHVARFLGRRIPHDYGQVPVPLFWLLLLLWLAPWAAFVPAAIANAVRTLRASFSDQRREPGFALLIWTALILGFFTFSSRQEYYHLPALPALALLVGGLLAKADRESAEGPGDAVAGANATRQCLRASQSFLLPLCVLLSFACGYFALTAPRPRAGADLNSLLTSNPALYNLSLGHVFDLTSSAMGFFRGPLVAVALAAAAVGPGSHLLRRRGRTLLANFLVAAGMCIVLLAAHEGLARFYPILGSKDLAESIKADGLEAPVLIDGELTSGSSLLFYLDNPVLFVNGRINGLWFGSFWPDARNIFLTEDDLLRQWHSRSALYLMTYHPEQRAAELCKAGPVRRVATSGGKTVLGNNRPSNSDPAKLPGIDLCSTPATPPVLHP